MSLINEFTTNEFTNGRLRLAPNWKWNVVNPDVNHTEAASFSVYRRTHVIVFVTLLWEQTPNNLGEYVLISEVPSLFKVGILFRFFFSSS